MSAERQCQGALNIAGEHYRCDLPASHGGAAHANTEAQAIWDDGPGEWSTAALEAGDRALQKIHDLQKRIADDLEKRK